MTAIVDLPVDRTNATEGVRRIPFGRLVAVEARKAYDTRAGAWLLAALGILAVLASAAAALWAPDEAITYDTFATAVGFPMSVLLPVLGILAVTSEYSQRTALTTYTLVPHRGRVLAAKYVVVLTTAVVSMGVALAVGVVGNLVGAAANGLDPVWGMELRQVALIVLAQSIGMTIGFVLGILLRSSAAGIVAYFVYSLVLPGLFGTLAAFQDWFRDLQPWVDLNLAATRLYDAVPTGEQWAQLGVTAALWMLLPLVLGVRSALRAEVA
jgi:ABC-2 type transport system permease protein